MRTLPSNAALAPSWSPTSIRASPKRSRTSASPGAYLSASSSSLTAAWGSNLSMRVSASARSLAMVPADALYAEARSATRRLGLPESAPRGIDALSMASRILSASGVLLERVGSDALPDPLVADIV